MSYWLKSQLHTICGKIVFFYYIQYYTIIWHYYIQDALSLVHLGFYLPMGPEGLSWLQAHRLPHVALVLLSFIKIQFFNKTLIQQIQLDFWVWWPTLQNFIRISQSTADQEKKKKKSLKTTSVRWSHQAPFLDVFSTFFWKLLPPLVSARLLHYSFC